MVSFGTRSHFGIPGLRTFTGRIRTHSFHAGVQSFGDDVYRENMVTAGGRLYAPGNISLGGELVLYDQSLLGYERHVCYSVDLGTHFQNPVFEAGAWVRNITVPRLSSYDRVPPCYSLHVLYRPEHFLSVCGAVSSIEVSMPFFSFGATYSPHHSIAIGIGVNSDPLHIEYSAAFFIGAISVQYCGSNHQYLGQSHLFQLTLFQ